MEVKKGTINELSIFSKSLSEEIGLLIYIPTTFSELYKYNILIAQDGRDYFTLGRISRVTEELLGNHEIDNTIIVGIPYKDVKDRWDKYHPEGKKNSPYIRFLAEELVPFLDKKFPTYQMGLSRVLIGDSLAGTISLLTAIEYPHTFGKVILQSPFVNEIVLDKIEGFNDTHLVEMYHIIGKDETNVATTNGDLKDFITPNRKLHEVMKRKGFPHFYEEFDGYHTWKYWQPDIPRALSKMLKNY